MKHQHNFKAASLLRNLYHCAGCGKTGYRFGKTVTVDKKQRLGLVEEVRKEIETCRVSTGSEIRGGR